MKRGTPDHPKTAELMTRLGIVRYEAVGLLELLWHFTARYAPLGDVGRWTDHRIATAVSWGGAEPALLIRALVDSGWLDECKKHRLIVHDWADHADDAAKKYVQRKNLQFATVERPKSRRVSTRPDKSRRVTPAVAVAVAVAVAKPEPKPEPEPEPAPVAGDDNESSFSPGSERQPSGNGSDGVTEAQHREYADAVWLEFLRVSGEKGTRLMTPGEFSTVKGWMDVGIPLRVVLRGMADTKGKGRMLGYYNSSVLAAFEYHRQAVPL